MNSKQPDRLSNPTVGLVLRRSRRHISLLNWKGLSVKAKATARELEDVTVGDYVRFVQEGEQFIVKEILPRTSFLSRSADFKTRRIAANISHLLIVTAPVPLFNTAFIDRILTAAYHQNIPCTLILNKSDLDLEDTLPLLSIYDNLQLDRIILSAKTLNGFEPLKQFLAREKEEIVAFAGISGVGKSTILNALIPDAQQRTGEVSDKTGQGRQTTSNSIAYRYKRTGASDLFIIDLPGIQNFGISDLTARQVKGAFIDFHEYSRHCEYTSCNHLAEPVCGVKDAIEAGKLAETRYISYLGMLEEIERARPY